MLLGRHGGKVKVRRGNGGSNALYIYLSIKDKLIIYNAAAVQVFKLAWILISPKLAEL